MALHSNSSMSVIIVLGLDSLLIKMNKSQEKVKEREEGNCLEKRVMHFKSCLPRVLSILVFI